MSQSDCRKPHCEECNDPDYIPPSAETLEILRKAIEEAKMREPIYLGSFVQYAEDE